MCQVVLRQRVRVRAGQLQVESDRPVQDHPPLRPGREGLLEQAQGRRQGADSATGSTRQPGIAQQEGETGMDRRFRHVLPGTRARKVEGGVEGAKVVKHWKIYH